MGSTSEHELARLAAREAVQGLDQVRDAFRAVEVLLDGKTPPPADLHALIRSLNGLLFQGLAEANAAVRQV